MILKIYTDGSCSNMSGHGGWGAVFFQDKIIKKMSGTATSTTSNRMELTAVVESLESLSNSLDIMIITDSKYIIKGANLVDIWKNNNWRSRASVPIKNIDLWERFLQSRGDHDIQWRWVKSHSGDWGNNLADKLANKARRSLDISLEESKNT